MAGKQRKRARAANDAATTKKNVAAALGSVNSMLENEETSQKRTEIEDIPRRCMLIFILSCAV